MRMVGIDKEQIQDCELPISSLYAGAFERYMIL